MRIYKVKDYDAMSRKGHYRGTDYLQARLCSGVSHRIHADWDLQKSDCSL